MEVRAIAKYVKVQPRKVRVVAAEVKGASAVASANKLRFHPSKSAFVLRKVLISAISNAEANHNLSAESLRIKSIAIDQGPVQKRMDARAMGRGARIRKKTAHITVIVEDDFEMPEKKTGKAKPRPKFAAPAKAKKTAKAEEAAAPVEEVTEEAIPEVTEDVTEETAVEATEAGSEEKKDN